MNSKKRKLLSKEEKEDLGLFLLMEQANKNDTVSKNEVMKALYEPNEETIKAIEEAHNGNLYKIDDLDTFLDNL
ncbi:MAG: hypothetical protein ACK5MZ_00405 [Aestuariibaculum sp.]